MSPERTELQVERDWQDVLARSSVISRRRRKRQLLVTAARSRVAGCGRGTDAHRSRLAGQHLAWEARRHQGPFGERCAARDESSAIGKVGAAQPASHQRRAADRPPTPGPHRRPPAQPDERNRGLRPRLREPSILVPLGPGGKTLHLLPSHPPRRREHLERLFVPWRIRPGRRQHRRQRPPVEPARRLDHRLRRPRRRHQVHGQSRTSKPVRGSRLPTIPAVPNVIG